MLRADRRIKNERRVHEENGLNIELLCTAAAAAAGRRSNEWWWNKRWWPFRQPPSQWKMTDEGYSSKHWQEIDVKDCVYARKMSDAEAEPTRLTNRAEPFILVYIFIYILQDEHHWCITSNIKSFFFRCSWFGIPSRLWITCASTFFVSLFELSADEWSDSEKGGQQSC